MHPEEREGFEAAWSDIDRQLRDRVKPVFAAPGPWRERMREALAAILEFLAEDPERARLYVADAIFAGEAPRRGQRNAVDELGAMIDAGRGSAGQRQLTAAHAEGVAGGLWHCVRERVLDDRTAELPALLPELMYFIALPYLGVEAAVEELRQAPESPP